MRFRLPTLGLGALSLLVLAACSDGPTATAVDEPGVEPMVAMQPSESFAVTLCKSWIDPENPPPAFAFDFTYAGSDGSSGTASRPVNLCDELPDRWAGSTELTITELVPDGFRVGLILLLSRTEVDADGFPVTTVIEAPASPSVTFNVGQIGGVYFKNLGFDEPPSGGGEGCTPGFWRQPHHFRHWVGYAPGDSYAAVFGVNRAGTLHQNVTANGGGANALARHSVAALLNASSPNVDYALTVAQVIQVVQDAYATGRFEAAKDYLEGFNERGCPL